MSGSLNRQMYFQRACTKRVASLETAQAQVLRCWVLDKAVELVGLLQIARMQSAGQVCHQLLT